MKKLGNNPKDNLGIKKVSITKLPAAGIIHGSHAMMYGADKYGPYNWRGNAVVASIYVDAIMRHVMAWFDQRQEVAEDSGVHHLGHILANCAILLDAMETGNLLDDRPHSGQAANVLERLNEILKQRAEAKALAKPEPKPEAKYELGPIPDATGDSSTGLYGEVGPDEFHGHTGLPQGTTTVVPAQGSYQILYSALGKQKDPGY